MTRKQRKQLNRDARLAGMRMRRWDPPVTHTLRGPVPLSLGTHGERVKEQILRARKALDGAR